MPADFPDGEGPIDNVEEARKRAKAEHGKPEHAPKEHDPRDKGIDSDLEDPRKQEKDK